MKKILYFISILIILIITLIYNPITKNIIITTSMQTMNHKWIAQLLYSNKTINNTMKNNYIKPIKEKVDTKEININNKKQIYNNKYEKELYSTSLGNNLYKVINVKVGTAKGYLVAIYNPKKISLIKAKNYKYNGERVIDMCKRNKGIVCINAGGFANGLSKNNNHPTGYVIDNGKIIWKDKEENNKADIIGITNEGILKLMHQTTGEDAIKSGIKYGIEFGPFLIINGKSSKIKGTPHGIANKSVIAQRKDGTMLFLVTESYTYMSGASLKDVIKVLKKYGAHNAANLDGGQSVSLVINNKLINTPNYSAKKQGGRLVSTSWALLR